ncbi:archaea-specific SMC-related protein [Halorussus sp. MSC15.2]|uniref:archaea-specific SMC-related protein n=1 Tax=Halorussus sp. MSC15.2 TaxID=2283638 RepID=UPI0013D33EC6|nr:archaea-specific SMC-related protein [Halorussus sp. MSC15.2]NEU58645.1 AAA family ATPase [Halorussus sp. MSC15.2]
MNSTDELLDTAHLSVENVGGIAETELTFRRGVNVLTGRNATNRTSSLQALMAVLGSDRATLKADAERGHVELTIGDDTYTRTLTRTDGDVVMTGEPLADTSVLSDLYAFLLENNESRRAVARGDDLREVIMRPVDTDEIQAEIDRLEREKRRLTDDLESLSDLERRLPKLVEEETRLERELEETSEQLEVKKAEIDASNADIEETRAEKDELEAKLEELQAVRSSLEDTRHDIETNRESIERLREELDEYRERKEQLPAAPAERIDELDAEIDRLRRRKRDLESDITQLQSIIQFNQDMLDDYESDVLETLGDTGAASDDGVTDQLLGDRQEVTCWTCGSAVERDQIDSTTEQIREFQSTKRDDRRELETRISELVSERDELKDRLQTRERLENQIEESESELADREERVEELRIEREGLESELTTLNDEVESLRSEDYDEILDLHREANELEFECDRLRDELSEVREEIAQVESQLDERESLEAERDEIDADLEELRTRVSRIEREAVEAFNRHMEELLDVLDYSNLDRIWLERTETDVREGRRTVSKTTFDLHVVRSTESGTAYEDTIDHLSESEREVTGLVFALAGFLVHDVHERISFMLLDSLEAIDSERIAALVEYFESYVDYVVVALLPEDADALPDDYERLTDI